MSDIGEMYRMTNAYNELLQLLYDEEADDQTVIDTLDSLEGAMEDKADALASMLQGLQNDIDALDKEIKRLQGRKKTLENSGGRLKGYIEAAMRATGKTKFKTTLYTYGIRKAGARALVLDVDAAELPPEFQKITVAANTTAIKDMLKAQGVEECAFAHLAPASEFLSIK